MNVGLDEEPNVTQSLRTYSRFIALSVTVIMAAIPVPAVAQTPFSHNGVDGLHPGSSVLPNEQVDPASGNLTVVATDLVLPGNAGLDIRVTRVYNSAVYPDYTKYSDRRRLVGGYWLEAPFRPRAQ